MTRPERARVFVDTNILFYSLDLDAGEKHARAVDALAMLWSYHSGIISTQVISELILNIQKKLGLDSERIERVVEPYLTWHVVVIDPHDPLEAVRTAAKNRISFWDAMIVTSARKAGAGVIYTEDLNPGQKIEGVEVVDPLSDSFTDPGQGR